MTTIRKEKRKCFVCGAVNRFYEMGSTNAFGSPDLDLRPPEMERSTMDMWIQACPKCGYVSSRIDDPVELPREWFSSDKYLTTEGITFISDLADAFYKRYMICTETDDTEAAFSNALYAAWECDDCGDMANAKLCRSKAVNLAEDLIKKADDEETKNNYLLIKADLLRRSGCFDRLINEYSKVSFDNELLNSILEFHIEKAKEKDDECYTVEDARDARS